MAKKAKVKAGAKASRSTTAPPPQAESYLHPTADSPSRPDVGTQAAFRRKKPPAAYRYDSSLSPALDWDGQNSAREQGEAHICVIEDGLSAAAARLQQAQRELEKPKAAPAATS